jgi:hypothetical protein
MYRAESFVGMLSCVYCIRCNLLLASFSEALLLQFRLDRAKSASFHADSIIAIDSLPLRWD